MISLTHRKNQKIFVLGLGLSGKSTVNSLCSGGALVHAWDDNADIRKTYSEFKKILINPDEINIKDYDAIILSPGINFKNPIPHSLVKDARLKNVPILGDIPLLGNLFKKQMRAKDKREILIFITPKIIDENFIDT